MIGDEQRPTSCQQLALGLTITVFTFFAFFHSLTTAPLPLQPSAQSSALAAPKHSSQPRSPALPAPAETGASAAPAATGRTEELFAAIGYHLDGVREHGEVPRLFMDGVPQDLAADTPPERRKEVFIRTALPLILQVNEQIAAERRRIEELRDRAARGDRLADSDVAWLERKSDQYGLEHKDGPDFAELLRRVDVIPPSLALAQAAEESGWGTSRFAREGNALFGQKIWREGEGLVTQGRDSAIERFAAFTRLIDCVTSYARNLNTHPAYEKFRSMRLAQRDGSGAVDGFVLAGALTRYSERGPAYIRTIRTIIRTNGLGAFEDARLARRPVVVAAADAGS